MDEAPQDGAAGSRTKPWKLFEKGQGWRDCVVAGHEGAPSHWSMIQPTKRFPGSVSVVFLGITR